MTTEGGQEPYFDLFEQIVESIHTSEEEHYELKALTDELGQVLKNALGEDYSVRLFGSFLRGTQLSKVIDPDRDVDILIYMARDMYHLRYSLPPDVLRERLAKVKIATEPAELPAFAELQDDDYEEPPESEGDYFADVLKLIRFPLEQSGFRLSAHDPFMRAEKNGISFDLVVASQTDEHLYLVSLSAKQIGGTLPWHLTSRYSADGLLVMGESSESGSRSYSTFSAPFRFNTETYNNNYGFLWVAVALVWKYWKVTRHTRVTSWMIDSDVLDRLSKPAFHRTLPKERPTPLAFVAHYFGSRHNYHFELFKAEPGFLEFKRKLRQAAKFESLGLEEKKNGVLMSLFSHDYLKEVYRYYGFA